MSETRTGTEEKRNSRKSFGTAIITIRATSGTAPTRWICNHRSNGSDIEAYIVANDRLEIIAQTRQAQGINAKANADLIVRAVNDYEKHQALIAELLSTLELCMASDSLSWEAEQEAELVCARARQTIQHHH